MKKKHIIPAFLFMCSILSMPVPAKASFLSCFPWKTAMVASVAVAVAIPSVRNTIILGSGWIYSGILKTKEYFTNRKLHELDQKVENGFSEQKDGVAILAHELMVFRGLIDSLHEKIDTIYGKVGAIDEHVATKDDLNGIEFRLKQYIGGSLGLMNPSS